MLAGRPPPLPVITHDDGALDSARSGDTTARGRALFMLSIVSKVLIMAFVCGLGIFAFFQRSKLKSYLLHFIRMVKHAGPLGPVLVSVSYGPLIAAFFPIEILVTAAGYVFTRRSEYGPALGLLISLISVEIALIISCAIDYLLVRLLIGRPKLRTGNEWLDAFNSAIGKSSWTVAMYLRLIPLIPFALSNCLLGVTCLPLRPALLTVPFTSPFVLFTLYIGSCLPSIEEIDSGTTQWRWDFLHVGSLLLMACIICYAVYKIVTITLEERKLLRLNDRKTDGLAELEPLCGKTHEVCRFGSLCVLAGTSSTSRTWSTRGCSAAKRGPQRPEPQRPRLRFS